MDCFLDFCLACDKQTMDGLYCSQACRLADLEKAGSSAPASPSTNSSIEQEGWPSSRGPAFTLPPGFDFSSSKSSTKHSSSSSGASTQRERTLSPSSSRSSLTSSLSAQTNQPMSEQTQHELNDYVSSFDAIREMKRRSLSSIAGH